MCYNKNRLFQYKILIGEVILWVVIYIEKN